jgi:hypothetical protein
VSCLFCSCNGFRYVQASSTIATFKALHEFGNTIIPAESGELASGLLEKEEWQNLQLFLVFGSRFINYP